MPKRGGQRNNYNNNGNRFGGLNFADEVGDRVKDRATTRRVSFKPSGLQQNKGSINSRMADMAIRSLDVSDMGDFLSSRYESNRAERTGGRRKGSPIPRGKFGTKKLVPSSFGWYQVTINYGQKYNKEDLIQQISATISPEQFVPHYWRTEKHCIVFFVDDFRIAEVLQSSDRYIEMYGFKLPVRVRPGTPPVAIDERYKEQIKLAMIQRYNHNTKALDLTKFNTDPAFKNMFFSLGRPQIMSAVLDIIEKHIPDLVAINLNDNHLTTMESFKNIAQRFPCLKILYLDDNRIPSLAHLLVFKNANITELALKLNPLRYRYRDESLYISEVRKKFPKLTKLDGKELEPQILFDVNDTASLPQPKASFLCDAAGQDIIRQFLEQYFIIFDSDNRQPLLDAYHEHAMLSIALPPISQSGRLAAFSKLNRNLRRPNVNNDSDKSRLLKFGRLPVVSTFTEWPKTQHDPQSFTVDLTLFTPKLISFTVAGLFKEFNVDNGASTSHNSSASNSTEIRYFQRQLIIVPAGGGFCIRNELIFLTSATYAQTKKAFKPAVVSTPMSSNPVGLPPLPTAGGLQSRLQVNQPSTSLAASPGMMTPQVAAGGMIPDETTKLQMIQAMSTQSNMNLEWSRKCLEETNWDYNHAAFVFDKLQKESKIPPEAFVK